MQKDGVTHIVTSKLHEILEQVLHLEKDFRVITQVGCLPKTPLCPIHLENSVLHDIVNVCLLWRRGPLAL